MMKTTLRDGFATVGLFLGFLVGAQVVAAQSFSFPVGGFTTTDVCVNKSNPPPTCQVLTNGSLLPKVVNGGVLRLTSANLNQHGSAWFRVQQPLSTGFTSAFQFQISSTNSCHSCSFPADGLAFVIQNDPAATGALGFIGNGANLSYGNNDISSASGPGKAIRNSLAIELDTHQNSDYSDPDGNHIAVQSCGPNNATTLSPNSADHNFICADGNLAKLALQSLPAGVSLSDGAIHTITVNYLPPGSCTSACNNLAVFLDSNLILQATVDIARQLNLSGSGGAYVGFTAATGSSVQNNDIVSWTFSSLPLAPITINQPLQSDVTNFNYTPELTALTDYSQSGLGGGAFNGIFMQGTVQTITDQQFSDLVNNTPFQGSTCQREDTGNGTFGCVTTTDLCTTATNGNASGANCPSSGTDALIIVSNTYNLDPAQKPVIAPGYIMGKDTALTCGASGDNTCKGLTSIFNGINGDALTTNGRTNNFNSVLIPILGVVQPTTAATTSPALNAGWTNGSVTVNFNTAEIVPANNMNPPATLPTITNIAYSAAGANLPSPPSGTLTGSTGSIVIPGNVEGTTVLSFFATDSSGTIETVVTNSGNQVTSASPTLTIQVDKTAPTANCVGPNPPPSGWVASDVIYNCTASDSGSGLANSSQAAFSLSTNVATATETNAATISAVTISDVAGNSVIEGPFGPFEVDKKAPVVTTPSLSVASPVFGQGVMASYTCSDGGSGVVLCAPSPQGPQISPTSSISVVSPVDTSSVGPHTFIAYAQDLVGNASSSAVSYSVGQATPTITWPTPAPITSGTPLSSIQLNATANVPGTFVYNPPAGTVLPAGSQTLSVTFAPTDAVDYTTASAHVTILVTQPLITLSPTSIDFGTVKKRKTVSRTETLSNPGSSSLSITNVSIKLGNADKDDFTFTSYCGSTLAAGASCNITVRFYADDQGTRTATLVITDSAAGSPQSVPLTGKVDGY
jgi:Legume lectin domain/Abnormal spindle-like microcephaly-assoc'd, ASPM-SPD-2-Hydin